MGLKNNLYRSKIVVLTVLTLTTSVVKAQLYINNSKFFIDSASTLFVKQHNVKGNYSIVGKGTLYLNGTIQQNINMNGNTIPNLKVDNAINVNIDSTCQTGNIILQPSALLTVNNQFLRVSGSITNNNGSIDITNGSLEINGTAAQVLSGTYFKNKTIKDLILSNSSGVSLSGVNDTLKIAGVLNFGASNVTLTTNNNLTISSTASNTACVADITSNGSYSGNEILGNVTTERYIQNKKAWRLMYMPTKHDYQTIKQAWQEGATDSSYKPSGYGIQITGGSTVWSDSGFDKQTSTPSVKTYNPVANNWEGILSTKIRFDTAKAYMVFVRGDRTVTSFGQSSNPTVLREKGSLNSGDITWNNLGAAGNQFVAIGNPYPSAISLKNVTTVGLDSSYYLWDPLATNSIGYGGFQTFKMLSNGQIQIAPGGASYSGTNTNIESGQGFFVHTNNGPGSITFRETDKATGSNLVSRVPGQLSSIRINMFKNVNNEFALMDGVLHLFDSSYSNNVNTSDALKLFNPSENIAIKFADKNLAIEARSVLNDSDTLHYAITQMKLGSYKFEITPDYFYTNNLSGYLVDNYLHITTPVSLINLSSVNFDINNDIASYASDRFFIAFKTAQTLPVKIISIEAKRNEDKTATIKWKIENEINLNHYEIERADDGLSFITLGSQQPQSNNGLSYDYSFNDINAKTSVNYYRVKAISNDGQIQYSRIVKLDALNNENNIFVYPNPVKDNIINIQFENTLRGLYSIMLFDIEGKNIFNKTYNISVNNGSIKVVLPKNTVSGNYLLKIIQPNGTISTQKILITTK